MTRVAVKGVNRAEFDVWREHLGAVAPKLTIVSWDDAKAAPLTIDYAFVWRPEGARLAEMSRLRAVISQAAGVDHILGDPEFPAHLPVYRMGGEEVVCQMGDYVCWAVFTLLRGARRWATQQARRKWEPDSHDRRLSSQVTVGVMGLGQLGMASLNRLRAAGFIVSGWARTARAVEGVRIFSGQEEFLAFLRSVDIVVSLLPATPETDGLMDATALAALPHGAGIVNAGRGNLIDEEALVDALRSGALGGAVLDVFREEPLPENSPLWDCPGLTITPHSASDASHRARAIRASEIIAAIETGGEGPLRVDPALGY